jgi:hypothetical protein
MNIGDHIWLRKEHSSWQFDEHIIVGETKLSWVTVNAKSASPYQIHNGYQPWYVARYSHKLPKKLKGFVVADEKTAKLHNWANSERYRIAQAVDCCWDPNILLAVAKLVGHNPPEEL